MVAADAKCLVIDNIDPRRHEPVMLQLGDQQLEVVGYRFVLVARAYNDRLASRSWITFHRRRRSRFGLCGASCGSSERRLDSGRKC